MPKTTDKQSQKTADESSLLPEQITAHHKKYSKLPEVSPAIIIQSRSGEFRRELVTILRGMIGSQKIEVIDAENIRDVIARVRERVVVALFENSCVDASSLSALSPHTARIAIGELPDWHITKGNIDYVSLSLEPVQGEGSMLEDWLRARVKRSLDSAISSGLARRGELLEQAEQEAQKKKKGRERARK